MRSRQDDQVVLEQPSKNGLHRRLNSFYRSGAKPSRIKQSQSFPSGVAAVADGTIACPSASPLRPNSSVTMGQKGEIVGNEQLIELRTIFLDIEFQGVPAGFPH